MSTLMPIFCFNFNFIFNLFSVASFSIYIFLLNNFIFFIFVLCSRLQCQHSCQYFVWTLISFLISFSVTSFSISIFLFNNFILYYFYCCVDNCNVDTHAKNIPSLRVHMYRAQDPDQFSVHSLYSTDDARTTARGCRLPTNQGPASYISDQSGASKNSTTWHRKEGTTNSTII